MSRIPLFFALITLILLPTGCAPAVPEIVHPDDDLMTAIHADDCMALWPLMTTDVQWYFGDSAHFCDYYRDNKSMFFEWAMRIHDRLMAEDIEHYAYIENDPEGAVRMKKSQGEWHFELPVIVSNIYNAERLKERFNLYLKSRAFRNDIESYLSWMDTRHAHAGMGEFLKVLYEHEPASIQFEGPFARVGWEQHPIEIIYYYHKTTGAEEGAWEIYRCLF